MLNEKETAFAPEDKEAVRECKSCSKERGGIVNAERFITKLDSFFKSNDLRGAASHIEYWEREAENLGDTKGLITVLNEELGFYRRTNDCEKGLRAVDKVTAAIRENGLENNVSAATVLINAATTMKAFGKAQEGLSLYDEAQAVYVREGKENTFEYAAMLNNKASALTELKRFDEAEKCLEEAMEILKKDGAHDGEIAVSLINLAHLIYDRDDTAIERVEETLDMTWDYINSKNQPHDANYAFIISKIAPSFRYFKREIEAEALEETAAEIYGSKNG